jgi:hypothetical protein
MWTVQETLEAGSYIENLALTSSLDLLARAGWCWPPCLKDAPKMPQR